MPQNTVNDKSILVQVMVWCRQSTVLSNSVLQSYVIYVFNGIFISLRESCIILISGWLLYPPAQRSCWGGILVSLRPSVRPSVCPSVRPSRMPCPLCIIYSYGWILFILGTNDHYHERVCRAPWPLILTYIFKVIWPWLRKSCPLCSVYSSGWILPIFGTNDHYH